MPNIFAHPPHALEQEAFTTLLESSKVRIERIVSHGHASAENFWFDQPQREWVIVLAGSARLRFEDEADDRLLTVGDYVDIAPHRRHRVEWTTPDEPTVWLAVHIDS